MRKSAGWWVSWLCMLGGGCGGADIDASAKFAPTGETARSGLFGASGWHVEAARSRLREMDGVGRWVASSLRLVDQTGATAAVYMEGHAPAAWDDTVDPSSAAPPHGGFDALLGDDVSLDAAERDALALTLRVAHAGAARAVELGRAASDATPATSLWRAEMPGWEFKQELHLWSQKFSPPNKWPRTPYDHTATYTYVFKRPRGSTDAWTVHQTTVRCNHGACPTQEDMREYAVCDGMPVTDEGYSIRGECPGYWGVSHLCNDDTALQINQARGNPSNVCTRKWRFNRPSCDVHW